MIYLNNSATSFPKPPIFADAWQRASVKIPGHGTRSTYREAKVPISCRQRLAKLLHIDDWMFESYSAVGFSNEKNVCVVGTAAGTFAESTDPTEEIKAGWYTKEAVGSLLKDQHFAARTQAYCYLWSRQ